MKILCFTGSRAEYYILRPLFIKLSNLRNVSLELIISGGITKETDHKTLKDIQKDEIKILEIIKIPEEYSNHSQIIGFLCLELNELITKSDQDLCIVYADRYESFAYAITATHLNKIILHIEAGDITEGGTYDDYIRHCISKMSHLFCTSTKAGIFNVQRLGEESWRIIQSGLLSYDDMCEIREKDRKKIIQKFGLANKFIIILATMHPITLDLEKTKIESQEFFNALKKISKKYDAKIFITSPNSDKGCELINKIIKETIKEMDNTIFVESLGGAQYQILMSLTNARKVIVCGNSSSIIKEAPYFNAESLNVGSRQLGREYASTQVNCPAKESIIVRNFEKLIEKENETSINPYYVKNSVQKVIDFIFYTFQNYSKIRS